MDLIPENAGERVIKAIIDGVMTTILIAGSTLLGYKIIRVVSGEETWFKDKKTAFGKKYQDIGKETIKGMIKVLDERIEGQDSQKRLIANTIIRSFKEIRYPTNTISQINRKGVLLTGSSGTGKTELMRTIALNYGVPFVTIDCSTFTPSGYVGESVGDIITKLIEVAKGETNKVASVAAKSRINNEGAIVFLDEIDKLGEKQNGSGVGEFKSAVLDELLKMIEGSTIQGVDTSKIVFVAAGAFQRGQTLPQEFLGRFYTKVYLDDLTADNYLSIMKKPSMLGDIISQSMHQALIEFPNVYVNFTDEDYVKLSKHIYEINKTQKLGARQILSVFENMYMNIYGILNEKEIDFEEKVLINLNLNLDEKDVA